MSASNLPGAPAPISKSGPAVQTPGKPVTPTPPATAPPDSAAELAKLENARKAIELKERSHVVQVRKFAAERDAQAKTWGDKLSEYEQMKKERAQAKINPDAYLKGLYGEKYREMLLETQINGVPPAQVLASEMAAMEERIAKKFEEKELAAKKAATDQHAQALEQARRQLRVEGEEFLKANGKDYPVFKRLGGEEHVAALLAQRIESEYKRTSRRDESGELLAPGKMLTTKEAADLLESDILGFAEEAAAHEKYQPKLREKLQPPKPAPPAPGAQTQQRRTLSNDLTGSTPSGSAPAATDAEKREKALAARAAHIAARVNRP